MGILKVGNETALSHTSQRSNVYQTQQDFNALFQAMTNNDINGAQQAYDAIQQRQSAAAPADQSNNPLAAVRSDWNSLGQALQSGSLSTAQQVFNQLGQDALAAQQARHQKVLESTSALRSDIQSIDQALKSGDTTSARQLLTQLEQNLQNSRMAFGLQTVQPATPSADADSNNKAQSSPT